MGREKNRWDLDWMYLLSAGKLDNWGVREVGGMFVEWCRGARLKESLEELSSSVG